MACARTLLVVLATFAVAAFLLNVEVSIAENEPKAILGDLRYDYGKPQLRAHVHGKQPF